MADVEIVDELTKTPEMNVPVRLPFAKELGEGVQFGGPIDVRVKAGIMLSDILADSVENGGQFVLQTREEGDVRSKTKTIPSSEATARIIVQGEELTDTDELTITNQGVDRNDEQVYKLAVGEGVPGKDYTIRVLAPEEKSGHIYEKQAIVHVR